MHRSAPSPRSIFSLHALRSTAALLGLVSLTVAACGPSVGDPSDSPTPSPEPTAAEIPPYRYVYEETAWYSGWTRNHLHVSAPQGTLLYSYFGAEQTATATGEEIRALTAQLDAIGFPDMGPANYPIDAEDDTYLEFLAVPINANLEATYQVLFADEAVPDDLLQLQALSRDLMDRYFHPPDEDQYVLIYEAYDGFGQFRYGLRVDRATGLMTLSGDETEVATAEDLIGLLELLITIDYWSLEGWYGCEGVDIPWLAFDLSMGSVHHDSAYNVGCTFDDLPRVAALTAQCEALIAKYFSGPG